MIKYIVHKTCHLIHFKVYGSEELSAFTVLGTHHPHPSPEFSHHPDQKVGSCEPEVPIFSSLQPLVNLYFAFCVFEFDYSRCLPKVESSRICPYVAGLFHLTWCLQDFSTSWHRSGSHSFLRRKAIPFYVCTMFCLSVSLSDIWFVSAFSAVVNDTAITLMYKLFVRGPAFSSLGYILRVEWLDQMCLNFWGTTSPQITFECVTIERARRVPEPLPLRDRTSEVSWSTHFLWWMGLNHTGVSASWSLPGRGAFQLWELLDL